MMSKGAAIAAAIRKMHKYGRDYYVVISCNEDDIPGNDYHVADDYDLTTYYLGAKVIVCSADIDLIAR